MGIVGPSASRIPGNGEESDSTMVARKEDAEFEHEVEVPGALGGLLMLWRRFLTAIVRAARRLVPTASPAERPVLERGWLPFLGVVALAAGAAGGIALAPSGQPRVLALAAGTASILWGMIRWLLMRVVPQGRSLGARGLAGAWAAGALVYAVALTPELRFAAWAVSAVITWFALRRLALDRRGASWLVGVAWGSQALVVVLSWVATNAYVALLATRG